MNLSVGIVRLTILSQHGEIAGEGVDECFFSYHADADHGTSFNLQQEYEHSILLML